MEKVYVSQPRDSLYDNCTGWFYEADSRVILISCDILLHDRAKINKFELNVLNVYLNKYEETFKVKNILYIQQ